MGAVRRWSPWRELRGRDDIELGWGDLPDGCRGMLVDRGPQGRPRFHLLLDLALGRRERRAVLAHELVHHERQILYSSGSPAGLVQAEERWVELEAVARLVPLDDLGPWVTAREASEIPTMVRDVCDEFDVPPSVARDALRQLELQRARQRHPSGRR